MRSKPFDSDIPDDDEKDHRSFFRRHRIAIIGCPLLLGFAGTAIIQISHGHGSSAHYSEEVVINLPPAPTPFPTPPPPAPTPPPEVPPEQKMIEQAPLMENDTKPKAPDNKPKSQKPDEPPLGTNIKGDGSGNSFGLSEGSGNGMIGGGSGSGGGGGSRWGWYAGEVQATIQEAILKNSKTRRANMDLKVRIWPDATGRVIRAQLAGSAGDPAIDNALQTEVLSGLTLKEPPPSDMPSPILLHISVTHQK